MTVGLNSSLKLPCGITLPNRIAKAAMSEQLGDRENQPTEALVRLYARWAQGEAGLIITGNVMVDARALGEPCNVVIQDERSIDLIKRWAEKGKNSRSKIIMQINHPGRQSPRFLSAQPVAPSAVGVTTPPGAFGVPRALTESEIYEIIERFAKTADIAVKAGFDGVQIHGAHGYLVSQFLSPRVNQRNDQWGGSLENRQRFLLEIVRATRKKIGAKAILSVKLNSADFQRGGFSQEESMQVVQRLAEEQIDLLEISGGSYESAAMIGNTKEQRASTKAREAYFLDYAEKVRQKVSIPLMLTGGLRTRKTMEQVLADQSIDIIGLARPMAVNPDLPKQLIEGKIEKYESDFHGIGIASLDSFIELMWHTHQLHKMGAGREPNPSRSPWVTLATAMIENGWNSFRLKRAG